MSNSPAPGSSPAPYTEPWLRGTHTGVPAAGRAVLHALELAFDDIRTFTTGLTDAEFHAQPFGLTSLAFHIRHLVRSTDRLLTYAEGHQLSHDQLASLKAESTGAETLPELLATLEAALERAAVRVRTLASADLEAPRGIGRKHLPTSAGGAMIHVADHAQRHTGQIVTTAKLLKAMRSAHA